VTSVGYTLGLEYLIAGIKKADSLDTEKVRVGLETVNFVSSYYGPIKAGGKIRYGIAHQLLPPVTITQIKKCENVGQLVPGEEGPPPPPERKK